jgi:tRNA pseudouridine38-40 synthase
MQMAVKHLIGTHDFSAFRMAACQAPSAVKTIKTFTIQKIPDLTCVLSNNEERDCFEFKVFGNSFLQHQVRNVT